MTLGFPYRLGSVPIIDLSVIQEGARSHCLSSRTLPATAGRRRGVLTKGLSISESWHGRHRRRAGSPRGCRDVSLLPSAPGSSAPLHLPLLQLFSGDTATSSLAALQGTGSLAAWQESRTLVSPGPRSPVSRAGATSRGLGKAVCMHHLAGFPSPGSQRVACSLGRSRVLHEGGQRAGDRLISDLLHVLPLCAARMCSVQVGSHLCPQRTQA